MKPFVWILAMGMLLCGCERPAAIAPSGKVINVGVIAPFSGSDFAKGEEGLKGIQTAMKLRPLLDNGDRVELIIKNDEDDPAKSVEALKELVGSEQVAAVVTLSSSGPVLALANVADALGTPILAALATHPDVTKGNQYVSQICFDNIFQGQVAALYVRDDLLVDRVAVFKTPGDPYSSNLADEFQRKFTALGGQVSDRVELTNETAYLAGVLRRVREKDPELLYLPLAATDVITIIKLIRRMGWKPKLMASDGLLATVFSQHENQLHLLDGLLATDFFHHDSQRTDFGKRVKAVLRGRATSYTALGVEAFSILLEAMNRCDDPADRACINRQVRATDGFEGLLGKITIGPDGKASRPVVINTIEDERLEYLVKVY